MLALFASGVSAPAQETPTPGYVVARESVVPVRVSLIGRAVARNATQLRPQVGGTVTEILYRSGSRVEAGEPLFSIDPLTYEIAVSIAVAEHARAEADLHSAQSAFRRAEQLQGTTASRAMFEDAEANMLKARATLAESEANLTLARAQLEWTTVRAPISGIVGVPQVAVGDLVSQGQATVLAEIVQTDPVYVDLIEPYPTRMRIEARAARGEIELAQTPGLALHLADGRSTEGAGRLVSTSATVSATTGTRVLRFEMDNPAGIVAPGMFLHADLIVGDERAVLVPQRAAQRERDGTLFAWIARDGHAEKRQLTENGSHANAWVISDGVEAGEWILIDGLTNLREGDPVAPIPVEIDELGVVRDLASMQEPVAAN